MKWDRAVKLSVQTLQWLVSDAILHDAKTGII